MSLKNIDDLEAFVDVVEEDHVAFVGKAANSRAKFGASAADGDLEGGQLVTLGAKSSDKSLANRNIAGLLRNVGQDRKKISANGRKKRRPP